MPELGEVEHNRRIWAASRGERVAEARVDEGSRLYRDTDPAALAREIPGRVLEEALAHGKQMLFRFGDDGWLGVHLGMTGHLLRLPRADYEEDRHDHLALFTDGHALVFRDTRHFGKLTWETSASPPSWWQQLPPQVLDAAFDRKRLRAILERRAGTPLKPLLLQQEFFPGVGNWMADEILWRAALHPERRAGDLDEEERKHLYRELREVCRGALRVFGEDPGQRPPRGWLFPHRWKDGGTCPRTGAPLARIQVGGRTTCYCPARQGEAPGEA